MGDGLTPADHPGMGTETALHDRLEVAHLELESGEGFSLGGDGGESGSHGHVGEVAEDAAVDRAHGVVKALSGRQLDSRFALAERDWPHTEELSDRRQLEVAREPLLDIVG